MAPPAYPTISLENSDFKIPAVGFGTFEVVGDKHAVIKDIVLEALKAGYRHIDTAAFYHCEEQVGQAIRESGIPRDELFITTKFWNHMHAPEDVKKSLHDSLTKLGLDYVDLYLMHYPVAFFRTADYQVAVHEDTPTTFLGKTPILDLERTMNNEAAWKACEELQRQGKTRYVGVSNFSIKRIEALLKYAEIRPVLNQVETHPFLPAKELLRYCNENGILLQAFSPLGSQAAVMDPQPRMFDDEELLAISKRTGYSIAQILISWAVKRGTALVPKSSVPERVVENFRPVELSDEDFEIVNTLTDREVDPKNEIRYNSFFDDFWKFKEIVGESLFKY